MAELSSQMMKSRGAVIDSDLPPFRQEIIEAIERDRILAEMAANEAQTDALRAAESAQAAAASASQAAGIPEAPKDGKLYARCNGQWVNI